MPDFTRGVAICVSLLALAGCASRSGPEPIGDSSSPRLGWVIMHGSADNPDAEFACQSNPKNPCALPASTAQRRVFSNVYLYFHPIGAPARYEGTVEISFLGTGRPAPVALSVPAKGMGNNSVVGIVTDKPGDYTLALSLTAATPSGPVKLDERVPVTVR